MTPARQPIRILGVHGIRNHPDAPGEPASIADQRGVEWKGQLLRALAAAACGRTDIHVEIAYYAHHLHRGRPVAHTPGAELDGVDPDTANFLLDLADMLEVTGPAGQGVTALRAAMQALSGRFGLDGPRMTRFAERYLPDFSAYLASPDSHGRNDARMEVAHKINEVEPDIVIGHDLGSVVAYEALAANRLVTVTVPLFLTIGSPLGLRWVFRRLQPVPAGGRAAWPSAVRFWEDLYDQGDPFAVPRPLDQWFSGGPIMDRRVSLGPIHYHADSAYLSCAALGRALQRHFMPKPLSPPMPTWPGTARSMPDIVLTPADLVAFREALVNAFHNAERLRGILEDIQLPRALWPAVTGGTTDPAWRAVFHELREGAVLDGFRTLLATALRRYQQNETFQDLAARYAPELPGLVKAPQRRATPRYADPPGQAQPGAYGAEARLAEDDTRIPLDAQILLVGCASYPDDPGKLPELPSVRRNLDALAEVFTDPGILGVPAERVVVVRDPDLPRKVMKPLADLARREAELLIVYYAGHGVVSDGELRLGLTTTTTDVAASGLEARELRKEVANSVPGTRVLIADCCFSGRLAGVQADAGSVIEGQLDVRGVVVIASSASDAASLAPSGEPLTAFTGELVDVLRTGLPGKGPVLTVADVFRAVRARMRGKGRPEPRLLNTGLAALSPLCKNVSYRDQPGQSPE